MIYLISIIIALGAGFLAYRKIQDYKWEMKDRFKTLWSEYYWARREKDIENMVRIGKKLLANKHTSKNYMHDIYYDSLRLLRDNHDLKNYTLEAARRYVIKRDKNLNPINESEIKKAVSNAINFYDPNKLKIGKYHEGGIIFYLDETGEHGKICSTSDLGSFDWWEARWACEKYKGGGYTDWYLPSQTELNQICQNLQKREVYKFAETQCWSSTEHAEDGWAWMQGFRKSYCSQGRWRKQELCLARPIRVF